MPVVCLSVYGSSLYRDAILVKFTRQKVDILKARHFCIVKTIIIIISGEVLATAHLMMWYNKMIFIKGR